MTGEKKTSKQRKVSREVELQQEIRALDAAYRDEVIKLQTTMSAAVTVKLKTSLTETALHNKARDAKVVALRDNRDGAKKTAEKAYVEALRKAQGDRDRALREAETQFEALREAVDKTTSELTLPIREAFEAAQQQAIVDANAAFKALNEKYTSEREPRTAELKEIEQKRAEAAEAAQKSKNVVAAETIPAP